MHEKKAPKHAPTSETSGYIHAPTSETSGYIHAPTNDIMDDLIKQTCLGSLSGVLEHLASKLKKKGISSEERTDIIGEILQISQEIRNWSIYRGYYPQWTINSEDTTSEDDPVQI